jgi:hypothetical protein
MASSKYGKNKREFKVILSQKDALLSKKDTMKSQQFLSARVDVSKKERGKYSEYCEALDYYVKFKSTIM